MKTETTQKKQPRQRDRQTGTQAPQKYDDGGNRYRRAEQTDKAGKGSKDAEKSRHTADRYGRAVPGGRAGGGKTAGGRWPQTENRYQGKYAHDLDGARAAGGEQASAQGEAAEGGLVIGRNGVRELLRSGRPVDKLLVRRGDREGSIVVLVAEAISRGIPVVEVDREKLDAMSGFAPHQGVIAMAAEKEYVSVEDILETAHARGEDPLLIIADGLTDPYNLGALIRCAEGLGAHGLIIPKRRAVGLTPLVTKASAGAIEHLPVAKVTNLAQTVADLQKAGVWVYAAEADGQSYDTVNFTGPCALIFGSEGDGVSALLKERSDAVVSIPMLGHVNSLNVSTAAAIVIAEASRQHRLAKERRLSDGGETTAGKP